MSIERTQLPDPNTYFNEQGLSLVGPGKWKTTSCLFHGGSDSMRINTTTGCWVCMSCDAKGGDVLAYHMLANGVEFVEAARALGAWTEDGAAASWKKPTPLPPRAALSVMCFEATLTAVAAGNIAQGVTLTDQDRARLMVAASRIRSLAEAYA